MALRLLKIAGRIILVLVCLVIIVVATDALQVWSLPNNYLFYENQGKSEMVFFTSLGLLTGAVLITPFGQWRLKELWETRKKRLISVFVIIAVSFYCLMTNLACVTTDSVVSRTIMNPIGTTYSLEEIDKIETGFGDKKGNFLTPEYQKLGNFYYKIYIDDKKIVFHSPYPNADIERYEIDSYLELEEFDQKLEYLNIPKEGSSAGYTFCDFDEQYVERFLRIIGEDD